MRGAHFERRFFFADFFFGAGGFPFFNACFTASFQLPTMANVSGWGPVGLGAFFGRLLIRTQVNSVEPAIDMRLPAVL